MGFSSDAMNMPYNLKFVALPVCHIIGGTQTIGAVPGYAHAPLLQKFLIDFCFDGPVNVYLLVKFEVHRVQLSRVRGIIVGIQKCGQFLDTPTLLFS